MKVEINLYATLNRYLPDHVRDADHMIEVSEGITVSELLQQLNIPADQVKLIFLNGVHAGGDAVLEDGGRVGVFPPVGGG